MAASILLTQPAFNYLMSSALKLLKLLNSTNLAIGRLIVLEGFPLASKRSIELDCCYEVESFQLQKVVGGDFNIKFRLRFRFRYSYCC